MTQGPLESFLNDFQKIQIFEKNFGCFLTGLPIFDIFRSLGVRKVKFFEKIDK